MQVTILHEAGYVPALFGMGLSFGVTSEITFNEFQWPSMPEHDAVYDRMQNRSALLAGKGDGHDKFLRQLWMWLEIDAPLYWWKQFDQYGHTVTQSESTMHTLVKRPLEQEDFDDPIEPVVLEIMNRFIEAKDFSRANAHLPSSFLQKRVVTINYASVFTIIRQRLHHKLHQWRVFIDEVKRQSEHGHLFTNLVKEGA